MVFVFLRMTVFCTVLLYSCWSCALFQTDLSNLEECERKWCTSFNIDKCKSRLLPRKRKPFQNIYYISFTTRIWRRAITRKVVLAYQISKRSRAYKTLIFLKRKHQIFTKMYSFVAKKSNIGCVFFSTKNVCILTNFNNWHTPMKIHQTPFIMINLDEYTIFLH